MVFRRGAYHRHVKSIWQALLVKSVKQMLNRLFHEQISTMFSANTAKALNIELKALPAH